MSAATKSQTASVIEAETWVSLRTLSMMGLGPVGVFSDVVLATEPEAVGTDVPEVLADDDGTVRAVRAEAMYTRLGTAMTARARSYQPAWGVIRPEDRSLVGFGDSATPEEIARLCERRGVLVDGEQVDRKGLEFLGRLLAEEKRIGRFLGNDCVKWNLALQHIERVMVSPVEPDPEPPPAAPPVLQPWEVNPHQDVRRHGRRETVRSDHGSLFVERCKCLGLDWSSVADGMDYARERWARMFELYCVLGVNPDTARFTAWQRMPRYHAMQIKAYETVMG
jgi:hypothetical protein